MVATIPGTLRAFILPLARHFRAQGWQVDGMANGISTCADCVQGFDRVWDVEWSRNPLDPRNFIIPPQAIQKLVTQEKYDIVHVHTPVAAFVTRYALRNLKKQLNTKVIYTAHGFHFHPGGKLFKNAVFLGLEKLAARWHDYLVVINQDDEQAAKRYKLNRPENLRYMPGIGVDLNYYSPDATHPSEVERVRQELGLTPETPLLLSVAELNPGKRHQDILQALARLGKPDVCMAFAGEGPRREELQQLAVKLGVENQVRFLGFRYDITALMRAAAATVLASEREGLPRSVMESMCLEIPVIGAKIRGIRDLLADGCGYLFPVGDVEALTQAFAHVLTNPEEARFIGMCGRERMASYDLRQIIKLHESLYAEAMSADLVSVNLRLSGSSVSMP